MSFAPDPVIVFRSSDRAAEAESFTTTDSGPNLGRLDAPGAIVSSSPRIRRREATGPNDTTSKEDTFASQKYAEKLPEWLEANDPKLVSDDSSRRRMRGEDVSSLLVVSFGPVDG
jgi:hypothetical protein